MFIPEKEHIFVFDIPYVKVPNLEDLRLISFTSMRFRGVF